MERTLKIFLSCSFGAGIGTMVALGVNHYFWWLGLIVGGLIGYLSYEFKKVIEAMAEGYKRVAGWKPNKEYWKTLGLVVIFAIQVMLILYPLTFLVFVFSKYNTAREALGNFLWGSSAMLVIGSLFISGMLGSCLDRGRVAGYYEKNRKELKVWFKKSNFFTVYFHWLPRGIILITILLVKIIPKIILFLARFVKTVFLLIHSDIRLLCGMDAAIGAGIGYFTGSVIIGTFAGGILGAIQYEIVSKRILHLNAKTT